MGGSGVGDPPGIGGVNRAFTRAVDVGFGAVLMRLDTCGKMLRTYGRWGGFTVPLVIERMGGIA